MEEGKNQRSIGAPEVDFFLQWGNRKRLRCIKVKEDGISEKSDGGIRRKITYRIVKSEKEAPSLHPNRLSRNQELATLRSMGRENRRSQSSSSPEKEERYYSTRGSAVEDSGGRGFATEGVEEREFVWPKFYISLSSKEKEEDFVAMKGCKLPQRPKKRAKYIQRSIHLVTPGTWLADLSQERYEVREKKSSKKRARGLKAMKGIESDSE